MIVKTNIPGYVKDQKTGMVINKDVGDYQIYLAQRSKILSNNELTAKVEKLETDITEIKSLLLQVINKING
jgi:hypothetical protein